MNNTFLKAAAIVSCCLLLSFASQAKSNALTYKRQLNTSIGITADGQHVIGRKYEVCNKQGKVVMSGVIKSMETFYIATAKLSDGVYTFKIDGVVLQEFVVK